MPKHIAERHYRILSAHERIALEWPRSATR